MPHNKTEDTLYLFYDKESDNFPTHLAEFSSQTLFPKRVQVASAVYSSLIRHAKLSQLQSLLELFKYFDWLMKRQLSITNCFSANLSVSSSLSGFREKSDAFKVRVLVTFFNKAGPGGAGGGGGGGGH